MSKLKINPHHAGTGQFLAFALPGKGSDLTFAEIGPPSWPTGMAAKKESKHLVRALEKLIAWLERGMEG